MSGHTKWDKFVSDWFDDTPSARASLEAARAELDAKWEIECRYGNCVIFVSPDSAAGPPGSTIGD